MKTLVMKDSPIQKRFKRKLLLQMKNLKLDAKIAAVSESEIRTWSIGLFVRVRRTAVLVRYSYTTRTIQFIPSELYLNTPLFKLC